MKYQLGTGQEPKGLHKDHPRGILEAHPTIGQNNEVLSVFPPLGNNAEAFQIVSNLNTLHICGRICDHFQFTTMVQNEFFSATSPNGYLRENEAHKCFAERPLVLFEKKRTSYRSSAYYLRPIGIPCSAGISESPSKMTPYRSSAPTASKLWTHSRTTLLISY